MKEPQFKLLVTEPKKPYVPVLSANERRAYECAHRILTVDFETANLPCPGGRRSRRVDRIAALILESFQESSS